MYLKIILLFILSISVSYAQVNVTRDELPNTNSTDSTAVLNNVLRQNQNAINSIGAYFNSNGYLQEANGGTGTNLSAVPNGSILVQNTSNVGIGTINPGTPGQILYSNGPGVNPSFGAVPNDNNLSNVVFLWNGQTDNAGSGTGLITSTSTLTDTGGTTGQYFYLKQRNVSGSSLVTTVLNGKFKKIASISTLTLYSQIWESSTSGGATVAARLSVNGSTVDTSTVTSTLPTWVNSSGLDVSALTNGTVYDLTISINSNANVANYGAYLGAAIIFSS